MPAIPAEIHFTSTENLTMTDVKLGISPLSWTNQAILELGDDISFETCITEASQAGYIGLELGRKFPEEPKVMLAALADVGLSPVSSWYSGYLTERSIEAEWPQAEAYGDYLIALGCTIMVYGECGDGPEAGVDAKLNQNPPFTNINTNEYFTRLTELADRLQSKGIALVYHPHMMQPIDTNAKIDLLMQGTGSSVKLLLDTGHIAMSGGDYTEVMDKWWERIAHIHLKDMRQIVFENTDMTTQTFNDTVYAGIFTVPGDGDIDFEPLVRKIAKDGYQGWLLVEAEQDPKVAIPAPMARLSFDYLEGLLVAANIDFQRNVNRAG